MDENKRDDAGEIQREQGCVTAWRDLHVKSGRSLRVQTKGADPNPLITTLETEFEAAATGKAEIENWRRSQIKVKKEEREQS